MIQNENKRLYTRGIDQVLLDDFVRSAEKEFGSWLYTLDYNDDEKQLIRDSYRNMLTRINSGDNTLTARLGGGFHDSTGVIKNAPKGQFDPNGIASYYLENTLNGINRYEEKSNKTKWDDKTLSKAIAKRLWGVGGLNLNYFIDLDPYDKNKKARSQVNRISEYNKVLDELTRNFDIVMGEYDFTPELKQKALADIELLRNVFKDNKVGKNEYLALARILGEDKYDILFGTDKDIVILPDLETLPAQVQNPVSVTSNPISNGTISIDPNSLALWTQQNYPIPDSSILNLVVDLNNTLNYGPDALNKLNIALDAMGSSKLLDLLKYGLDGKDMNMIADFRNSLNGYNMIYDNNLIANYILNKLASSGQFQNLGNNLFYLTGIPTPNKSVGYVWDANSNQLKLEYIGNIDKNKLIQEYLSLNPVTSTNGQSIDARYFSMYTPSNKNGGILKANSGLKIPPLTKTNPFGFSHVTENRISYIARTGQFVSESDWSKMLAQHVRNLIPNKQQTQQPTKVNPREKLINTAKNLRALTNDKALDSNPIEAAAKLQVYASSANKPVYSNINSNKSYQPTETTSKPSNTTYSTNKPLPKRLNSVLNKPLSTQLTQLTQQPLLTQLPQQTQPVEQIQQPLVLPNLVYKFALDLINNYVKLPQDQQSSNQNLANNQQDNQQNIQLNIPGTQNNLSGLSQQSVQNLQLNQQQTQTQPQSVDNHPYSNNIWEAVSYNEDDLKTRFRHSYDANASGNKYLLTERGTDGATNRRTYNGDTKYDIESGKGSEIEALDHWENWKKLLTTNATLAEKWARDYKELQVQGMPHSNGWFDENDKFNFENFKNSTLWSDGAAGIGHDVYKGRTYAVTSEDGSVKYTSSIPLGYKLKEGNPTTDESGLISIFNLEKEQNPEIKPEQDTPNSTGSGVDGVGPKVHDQKMDNLNRYDWLKAIPALSELGLVSYNNHINDSIRDKLNDFNDPLINTYQTFSQIKGDLGTRSYYNKQGLGAFDRILMTSDANANNAANLQAYTVYQTNDEKGKLYDNEAIDKSSKLQQEHAWNNLKRNSDTANTNIGTIYKGQIYRNENWAANEKANLAGISNWGKKQINNLENEILEDEKRYEALLGTLASPEYMPEYTEAKLILDKISKWSIANPTGDITKESWYSEAQDRLRYLKDRMNLQQLYYTQDIYGFGRQNPYGKHRLDLDLPYFKRNW